MWAGAAKPMPSLPPEIDEGSAAVAGVDGGVRLDVDHRRVRLELAGDRADHAHRDRVLEPQRAAEGEHEATRGQGLRIAEGQRRVAFALDFQHRQVRLAVLADQDGVQHLAARLEHGALPRRLLGRQRQPDADALGALDDVGVGEDIAGGIDDHPRAAGDFAREQARTAPVLVDDAVAGRDDLHHGGIHTAGQGLDRRAEAAQIDRGVGRGLCQDGRG
jgi:hypothetical protein